jgi:outer membrane protein TolC
MTYLTADQLVRLVLARNPSLAQMIASWQAASARYPQVTSLEDPMLETVVAPASIGSHEVDFGYRVAVVQKFPFPGKLALRGASAVAEAAAAQDDVADMRLQLIESAQAGFAAYYLADRALAVQAEAMRLLRQLRDVARVRYEKGLVPQQDVLQADVELGRQEERGLLLERLRKVAVARLNTLMHRAPELPLPPPPGRLEMGAVLPSAAALHACALSQRPDLRALAERVRAEEAALGLAHREFYPDVELTAGYDTIMGNGPLHDLAPQVGVRINLPIRSARRWGAVSEAEAKIAQRRAELAARIDQVGFQLQEAYEQVMESAKAVTLYERTILARARKNVEAARSAYETGAVPFGTLLEAERTGVNLRDRYYETVADYFRRRAALERAMGGPCSPGGQ